MEAPHLKISYYLKQPVSCPVCGASSQKEEMLSGGGRLIARKTTDELRRLYEPSKKAGEVYPLIYPVTVCPECLYAAYHDDFPHIREELNSEALSQAANRKQYVKTIFPEVEFRQPRNLFSGAASYILSIGCYSFLPKDRAPTFKKALSSLRGAWTFDDLDRKYPGENYDKIKLMLYRKAITYYERTIGYAQTGEERIDAVKHCGPDFDKNYGFQGILFMFTLLLYKYGEQDDVAERIKKLEASKRIISRVFGSGRSSKSKPSFILDLAKDLYEKITDKVEELKGE